MLAPLHSKYPTGGLDLGHGSGTPTGGTKRSTFASVIDSIHFFLSVKLNIERIKILGPFDVGEKFSVDK